MKFRRIFLLALVLVMILSTVSISYAAPDPADGSSPVRQQKNDNLPDPLSSKQLGLIGEARQAILNGEIEGGASVLSTGNGRYIQLDREGDRAIWTVLGEFADLAHNTIPKPDRRYDNSTLWTADFSRNYYQQLLFDDTPGANSMLNFYIEQSSNRFAVRGDVSDWITVPGNAADYDDNDDNDVWKFLEDSVNGWYATQIAAGQTPEQINDYLNQFDVWDRYDYNNNGNFDEPDGYIDTFQSVHAGLGEEAGAPDWMIWSHSWYVRYDDDGITGPSFNKAGGIQVGDSNFWVGKYTIQPENGGVCVFAHEFGHDLGLPDLYDYYGTNGTGYWTLMSHGSWLSDGKEDIGSKPSHMGAWEKYQLGWLTYNVASAATRSVHKLGPMEFTTRQAQGLFVILPDKTVQETIGTPYAGNYFYYSGSANNLNNKIYKAYNLAAGSSLAAMVQYGIETGYDYASVIISTDNGANWQTVPVNLSNSKIKPNGFDGNSAGWVSLTADLSAYTGNVLLGFQYVTDGGVNWGGLMLDEIAVTGYPTDGAESDGGWTCMPLSGFKVTTGTEFVSYSHYYVVEYRTYKGYDAVLKTGPYYFGYGNDPEKVNYVDHFAYQDGMLINYYDTSVPDNNTALHPGQGLLLPVDAHPKTLYRVDGKRWSNMIQTYDATFSLQRTDGIRNIHVNSQLSPVRSLPAAPVFDDTRSYYDPANPLNSVITPNTGTRITVLGYNPHGGYMTVRVSASR